MILHFVLLNCLKISCFKQLHYLIKTLLKFCFVSALILKLTLSCHFMRLEYWHLPCFCTCYSGLVLDIFFSSHLPSLFMKQLLSSLESHWFCLGLVMCPCSVLELHCTLVLLVGGEVLLLGSCTLKTGKGRKHTPPHKHTHTHTRYAMLQFFPWILGTCTQASSMFFKHRVGDFNSLSWLCGTQLP